MAVLKVPMADGSVKEIQGRRFSHYIGQYRFWFFLHESVSKYCLTVTHYESGIQVVDIPAMYRAASCGDDKAAAKMALDKLTEKVGATAFKAKLNSAGEILASAKVGAV